MKATAKYGTSGCLPMPLFAVPRDHAHGKGSQKERNGHDAESMITRVEPPINQNSLPPQPDRNIAASHQQPIPHTDKSWRAASSAPKREAIA